MTAAQHDLVVDHLPLVKAIAKKLIRLTHEGRGMVRTVEFDDLVQLGSVALIECVRTYNPSLGTFAAYAYKRVQGAMIDPHRRKNYDYELHSELHEGMRDTSEPVEEKIQRRQVCRHVTMALNSLSDEDQKLILERTVEEKTFAEIAESERQGTTTTFYRSRCAHGRLRDAMKRRGLR